MQPQQAPRYPASIPTAHLAPPQYVQRAIYLRTFNMAQDIKEPLEPPSYIESVGSTSAVPNAALPAASNYNSVFQSNGCIKGVWVVDTQIEVPAALRRPQSFFSSSKEENLCLDTNNGSIIASVYLVSADTERALFKARTSNGKLRAKVSRLPAL